MAPLPYGNKPGYERLRLSSLGGCSIDGKRGGGDSPLLKTSFVGSYEPPAGCTPCVLWREVLKRLNVALGLTGQCAGFVISFKCFKVCNVALLASFVETLS
jgi:hypothetical protein